jgi:predicted DCC family thiol-disulfide oxidoreductase YuxK
MAEAARALELARAHAKQPGRALVLYDGLCNVCNSSIRFALARCVPGTVAFASLQSQVAAQVLSEFECAGLAYADGAAAAPTSSIVLRGSRAFGKTDGSVMLMELMTWPFPVLAFIVGLIPALLRNAAYDVFAAQRFRLFGSTEAVQQLPEGTEHLFLDSHEGIHVCPMPGTGKRR